MLRQEWAFYSEVIDPVVLALLSTNDSWDAYGKANLITGLLTEDEPFRLFPHTGGVYRAWSEVIDLYEAGKTRVEDGHAALRQAATRWLQRPTQLDGDFIRQWIADTETAAERLFTRDGNWWHGPM